MGCNESKQAAESNAVVEQSLDQLDDKIDQMRRTEQDKKRKQKEAEELAKLKGTGEGTEPVVEVEAVVEKPPTPPPIKKQSTF